MRTCTHGPRTVSDPETRFPQRLCRSELASQRGTAFSTVGLAQGVYSATQGLVTSMSMCWKSATLRVATQRPLALAVPAMRASPNSSVRPKRCDCARNWAAHSAAALSKGRMRSSYSIVMLVHACVSIMAKIGTVWNPPWTEAGDHGTHPRLDLAGSGPTDPGAVGAVADPAPPPGAARPHAAGSGGRPDAGRRRGRRGRQRRDGRALAQPVPTWPRGWRGWRIGPAVVARRPTRTRTGRPCGSSCRRTRPTATPAGA